MMIKSIVLTSLFGSAAVVVAHSDVLNVHGSGTTNPSKCFWAIMEDFTDQTKHPIRMTYRAVGSGTGIKEFVNENKNFPAADFGSGDIPLPKADFDGLKAAGISAMQLPILLSAVSVFHNVPVEDPLDLDACLLARIFSRKITEWGHADIVERNPGLEGSTLPISVARRVLGSSSTASITGVSSVVAVCAGTLLLACLPTCLRKRLTTVICRLPCTQYLRVACPNEWPEESVGSVIDWPEDTMPCEGSGGVTDCITSTKGAIGYLDAGHGISENLPEIELENADGTRQTSAKAAERDGIRSALASTEDSLPASPFEDWSAVDLLNKPGQYTWPIVLLTYVYVRQDLSFMPDPDEQTLLKAFLKSLYDLDYVGQCVSDHGFTVITDSMIQKSLQAIESLMVDGNATEWTIESSTDPINAMGTFVISQKRRTHNEVERDVLFGIVEELQQKTAELELLVKELNDNSAEMEILVKDLKENSYASPIVGGAALAAMWALSTVAGLLLI